MRYNRLLDMRRRRLQAHRPRREASGASARHWAVTDVAQGLRRARGRAARACRSRDVGVPRSVCWRRFPVGRTCIRDPPSPRATSARRVCAGLQSSPRDAFRHFASRALPPFSTGFAPSRSPRAAATPIWPGAILLRRRPRLAFAEPYEHGTGMPEPLGLADRASYTVAEDSFQDRKPYPSMPPSRCVARAPRK